MSFVQYVCPISGKRQRVDMSSEDGVFLPVDEEENLSLPVGWGRLVIEQVIPNPEIAAVQEIRKRTMQETWANVQEQAQSGDEVGKRVQAAIDDGSAERDIAQMVEERHPLPEEDVVTVRLAFSALSQEAIRVAIDALIAAGFPLSHEEK